MDKARSNDPGLLDPAGVALLVDLYELTMSAGYLARGLNHEAVFELFPRRLPPRRDWLLAAGLGPTLELLRELRYGERELVYLRSLGLFDEEFLDYLGGFRFTGDVEAIPEGTVTLRQRAAPSRHGAPDRGPADRDGPAQPDQLPDDDRHQGGPHRPRRRRGRTGHGRSRPRLLPAPRPRRRRGDEGGEVSGRGRLRRHLERGRRDAVRAAAGRDDGPLLRARLRQRGGGIPLFHRGASPAGRCCWSTPTTRSRACATRSRPHATRASGSRASGSTRATCSTLSRAARELLDEAGMEDTSIAASGDLHEGRIGDLVAAGAPIDLWGVGTDLGTSRDSPVVNGVYKLVAEPGATASGTACGSGPPTRPRCPAPSRSSGPRQSGRSPATSSAPMTRTWTASGCCARRCAAARPSPPSRWSRSASARRPSSPRSRRSCGARRAAPAYPVRYSDRLRADTRPA